MDTSLPRWSVRLDAHRPSQTTDFSDLLSVVAHHFRAHHQAMEFLGPYNARQRGYGRTYVAPSRDELRAAIQQGGMNDFSYQALLNSLVRFCENTKGQRALPEVHPSVIHSIQLPLPAFELTSAGTGDTMIKLNGASEPLLVKGLRQPEEVKFIIVRPKLSKLGTASARSWEVLFFRQALGYVPDWVDSFLNPRFAGVYS